MKINEADVSKLIKDLGDNFGGSNEDQMKAVQLLKGLATSDDPEANKFMKALDKATSEISKNMSESTLKEMHFYKSDIPSLGLTGDALELATKIILNTGSINDYGIEKIKNADPYRLKTAIDWFDRKITLGFNFDSQDFGHLMNIFEETLREAKQFYAPDAIKKAGKIEPNSALAYGEMTFQPITAALSSFIKDKRSMNDALRFYRAMIQAARNEMDYIKRDFSEETEEQEVELTESFRVPGTEVILEKGQRIVVNEAYRPNFSKIQQFVGPTKEGVAYIVYGTLVNINNGMSPQEAFIASAENENFYGNKAWIVKEREFASGVLSDMYGINVSATEGF